MSLHLSDRGHTAGTVSDPTEARKPGIVGEGALLKGYFRPELPFPGHRKPR